jgi:general secretion pathway protein L
MNVTASMVEGFSRWIDAVASTVRAVFDGFGSRPGVKLIENEDGEFLLQSDVTLTLASSSPKRIKITDGRLDHSGSAILAAALLNSRVELMLRPEHFLFRPLEFPARATEFLNGIVRSQIDRLTPWNVADAAFGWSQPVDAGADRMITTIASIARARVKPYVHALAGTGAHSIGVFASPLEAGAGAMPIRVWEERMQKTLDVGRIRQILVIILATVGIAAGGALSALAIVGARVDAQHKELARQIATARTAAGAARVSASGSLASVQRKLEQRKHEVPSIVMVLETLSRILPDHTYLTELRVEGDKLRLVGMTRDAPSLIGLIEQSGHFTRATFFAPTTRSASSPGENFHIETIVRPMDSPP